MSELEVWTSSLGDGIIFCFAAWSSPSGSMVVLVWLDGGGISSAKATLPFLVARVTLAASSSAGELARVFFLGGIMGWSSLHKR